MFALNIPSTFGDTIDCRINGKPKRVTWRDKHTLVIEANPYAQARGTAAPRDDCARKLKCCSPISNAFSSSIGSD